MEPNKQYFRYLMLFYFRKRKNATQTKNMMCCIWKECRKRTCVPKLVYEIRVGDTTYEDGKHSNRPLVVDNDQIKMLIENNLYYTTRDIV